MAKYQKAFIEDLENLLYSAQSLKASERERLLAELNRRKLMDCPIADEHISKMLKGDFGRELKPQEEAYMEHAEECPVCYIINHLILAQLEQDWTLDKLRRNALLHLKELKGE